MMRLLLICFFGVVGLASCSLNNAEEDKSLGKYFEENGTGGSFGLFDNGSGKFTVYNMDAYRDSAYLPDSTFLIVNALIALETGVAKDSSVFTNWVLSREIGQDTIKHWVDTLGYATKTRPDEQLGLVKKLYFGQLPFQPRSQRMVKNMMKIEENANYKLSYKTGKGWLIGWIEENNHPYFFVLQTESPARVKMLNDILKHLGFTEGKR